MPSSSSSLSPQKYDIFISFAGQDTRPNFTSHLRHALCRNTIETYVDYRIERGDDVWSALEEAIEDSTLFLVIFSEHYASSTWCLKELHKILECTKDQKHHRVMPVFHKIEPTHVRKQTGSYEIAFSKHDNSNHKQHVPMWRDALTTAANLKGWHCTTDTDEVELIRDIVKYVLAKLDRVYQNDSSDALIGIDKQVANIESLLCIESQDIVRFIGIWGMGGIGKTTIAKAIFNKLCLTFESFCFLANVREESEKYGIVHLRKKLFSTLLEGKNSNMGMPDGGSTYAQRRLGRKKVLLVLDDVNDSEQLENLAGAHNWFGHGSRVIITTRDKQVLGKNIDDTYEVGALEFGEALQLFNLKAFKDNCLDEEFEKLSLKVVNYAQGIPLALIVLGSFLYGKGKEEWKSQLEKLKKMPNTKIQQILKLSYDGLDHEEKNIFLDVACFFKGRPVEHVKTLLDACGYSTSIGLKSLQDKALVTLSKLEVSMHDLTQQMGWEIVRQESLEDPGKRSRLWDANDIYQVLKYNKGSKATKSISLDTSKLKELNLSPQVFAKMPNLLFLEMRNSNDPEKHGMYLPQGLGFLPNELRYLHWDYYPLKSLPLTFSAENLVELRMPYSRMRKLWHGVQNVVNLKEINLVGSSHLVVLPDFSKAINLERVNLRSCASLSEVHPSILSLNKLESLALSNCVSLASLKSDIQLRSLNFLALLGCSNLKEFSMTSENMITLLLDETAINELPSCIGRMHTLEHLSLGDCKRMRHMRSNLFDGLHSLRHLHLSDCCNMFEVVDHVGLLSSLNYLIIEESALESLPASIKHLSSLERLQLKKCTRLRSLPQPPPSLISLHAIDCPSLQTVQFTSTVAEPFEGLGEESFFNNCVKLGEYSIKAILANAMVKFNKLLSRYTNLDYMPRVIYPGSRVPEWFKYKTPHASITIDLSSAPLSVDWGLLYCCIVAPQSQSCGYTWIECQGYIQIMNDERVDEGIEIDVANDEEDVLLSVWSHAYGDVLNFNSNHVYLWCDGALSYRIHQINERSATANSKISVELNFSNYFEDEKGQTQYMEIKECAACPTYAWEYQNFINEMEKESQASTPGMEIRSCCYNKDEEEAVLPLQRCKSFISPRLASAITWKNQTQGLKDIINL